MIAQESGNRANESHLAATLCRLEAAHGDTLAAFDHLTLAIRNYHDAGDTVTISVPLAVLAAVFDRLGHHEPAATIAGFAVGPFTAATTPELNTAIAHLREVLGDQTYESLTTRPSSWVTRAGSRWPWYLPSNITTTSRPVNSRASRRTSTFAAVAERVNCHLGMP